MNVFGDVQVNDVSETFIAISAPSSFAEMIRFHTALILNLNIDEFSTGVEAQPFACTAVNEVTWQAGSPTAY